MRGERRLVLLQLGFGGGGKIGRPVEQASHILVQCDVDQWIDAHDRIHDRPRLRCLALFDQLAGIGHPEPVGSLNGFNGT